MLESLTNVQNVWLPKVTQNTGNDSDSRAALGHCLFEFRNLSCLMCSLQVKEALLDGTTELKTDDRAQSSSRHWGLRPEFQDWLIPHPSLRLLHKVRPDC